MVSPELRKQLPSIVVLRMIALTGREQQGFFPLILMNLAMGLVATERIGLGTIYATGNFPRIASEVNHWRRTFDYFLLQSAAVG